VIDCIWVRTPTRDRRPRVRSFDDRQLRPVLDVTHDDARIRLATPHLETALEPHGNKGAASIEYWLLCLLDYGLFPARYPVVCAALAILHECNADAMRRSIQRRCVGVAIVKFPNKCFVVHEYVLAGVLGWAENAGRQLGCDAKSERQGRVVILNQIV